jgi:hypothetical protein
MQTEETVEPSFSRAAARHPRPWWGPISIPKFLSLPSIDCSCFPKNIFGFFLIFLISARKGGRGIFFEIDLRGVWRKFSSGLALPYGAGA